MKLIRRYLSDFINLIFVPENAEEEKLHSWWTISGLFLFLVFAFFMLSISS